MMGKQQGPGNVSECVKIDADRASGYCVMGILNTQQLRDLNVSNTTSASQRGRGGSPARKRQRQDNSADIIAGRDGKKTTPEERLWKWCRPLADRVEGREAIPKLLEVLDAKKLLCLSTHSLHTTLVQVSCLAGDTQLARSWPRKWELCVYDSLYSRPKVDAELQKGLAYFLETTGAKQKGREGNFTHACQPVRITQEDGVVCSLMTIIRLILILTGEQEPDATQNMPPRVKYVGRSI